jgi:hypothetical protein
LHRSAPRNVPYCTSITAAVAHNPHNTEIRLRFPPCQVCRRCISRCQQPQTSDEVAIAPREANGCFGLAAIAAKRCFDEWTEVFDSERLTGALLDRLTHHVHILEMNGESYRLKHSRKARQ